MKNKILIFVILTVLIINFTGCGKKSIENNNFSSTVQPRQLKENESKAINSNTISNSINNISNKSTSDKSISNSNNLDTSISVSHSPTSANPSSEQIVSNNSNNPNNPVMEAYKAIMLNKTEFFSIENKKNMYLNDFLNGNPGYKLRVSNFAVVDMDGDGVPEVVLKLILDSNNYSDFCEVFHYMNGKVYGYIRETRCLENIKTDGTFTYFEMGDNNIRYSGYRKLIFNSDNSITETTLGYREYSVDKGNTTIFCIVDNKSATEEEYNSFKTEQDGKKDVVWYEFIQKYIDANISTNLSLIPTNDSSNNKNTALEAYKAILQNKTEFFCTDENKTEYWNNFLTNNEYSVIFKPMYFTVIDMDGDKIPEVVIELSTKNLYEVLHYSNDKVYGYNYNINQLGDIKLDGTFSWSSSISSGYGKLRFDSTFLTCVCITDAIGYDKSIHNDDGSTTVECINDKQVTEEEYNSFTKEQDAKKDVDWYEFSSVNIESELSMN